MAMCSINIPEMTALVGALVSAQTVVPSDVSALTSTMEFVDLDTSGLGPARTAAHWVNDALVPTRRRLAMAQAIEAATPSAGTFVQFDESVLSTKTPAQAAADAKQAVQYLREGNTPALIKLLSAEGYDPYFAKVFAQQASCRALESYVGSFSLYNQLKHGVDPKQYETVLTALGQTLGLATRGQGDLALGPGWTTNFLQYMTAPKYDDPNSESGFRQHQTDMGLRSALMLIFARGAWSTPFLQQATLRIKACDKGGEPYWLDVTGGPRAISPQGREFADPVVALMSALAHNPAAARWAFTQGGTTSMPVDGHDVPVNSFIHYVLLDHDYFQNSSDASAAVLALRAAVAGDKYSPVALDVRTLSTSLQQQKAKWDALPWYSKWGHTILDAVGMIPVIGDVANVPNAAWYALEGDWANAGVTAAGMIPLVGDAALGGRVLKASGDVVKTLRMVDLTGKDIEDGLESAKLLAPATQIEPAVFKFDDLADFQLAANTPHPNVVYEFQGIRYTTDYRGWPISVSGTPLKTRGAADPALRRAIGAGPDAVDGDVGFHLFAESFGGPTNRLNTVPGNGKVSRENFEAFKNLNTSEYAKMENQVRAALKDPNVKDLNLTVEPEYLTSSPRPDVFHVTLTRNGMPTTFYFENAPVVR